jgi:hypothetical protein
MILETLGKPPDDELNEFITNSNAREYIDSLPVISNAYLRIEKR